MGVSSYSTTPASNNAASPNGAPEGMAPSGVNDTIRQIMADIRSLAEDGQWLNWGHTPTRLDDDSFSVATDLTAVYQVGRRLKLTGSATGYCTISASAYSAPNTTVDVTMDSGTIPGTLSAVYVSILTATSNGVPAIAATTLTGTLADARLSANVPLKNAANAFTANQTITGAGGTALSVVTVFGNSTANFIGASGTSSWLTLAGNGTTPGTNSFDLIQGGVDTIAYVYNRANADMVLGTNNTPRVTIAAAGNVTIGAASSGDELTVVGSVAATSFVGPLTGNVTGNVTGLGTLTDASTVNSIQIGYRGVPRSTTATTLAVGDVGKCVAISTHIAVPNSTFAAGDAVSVYNNTSGALNITRSAGTQYKAGTDADDASISLAARGLATIWFNSATEWVVSGNVS